MCENEISFVTTGYEFAGWKAVGDHVFVDQTTTGAVQWWAGWLARVIATHDDSGVP